MFLQVLLFRLILFYMGITVTSLLSHPSLTMFGRQDKRWLYEQIVLHKGEHFLTADRENIQFRKDA